MAAGEQTARQRLIYKRGCQGHFSPSTGRRESFLDFQPLIRSPRRWVLVFCTLVRTQVLRGSISVASLSSSDDADQFLELNKPYRLPGWQHIDLSEARCLELFRVVREGIGISQRLAAQGARLRLQAIRILTLEPERLKNRSITNGRKNHRRWTGLLPETLKRLVTSVSRRRSLLLSSTASA